MHSVIFISLFLGLLTQETLSCPEGCRCTDDNYGATVFCENTHFTSLPTDLNANTQQLYMQGNSLGVIPNRAFAKLVPNLKQLYLEDCGITDLQPGAFAGLKNLTSIDLKGNRLTTLRQGMFAGIEQVIEISIKNNDLQSIEEFIFDGFDNNLVLNLENNNNLKDISSKAFKGAVIEDLYFFNSSLTNESLNSILPLQNNLKVLFLSSNKLPLSIPHTLFRGFFLMRLNLANNGITDVSFLHHVTADDISLANNYIGTLNFAEFPSLRQTRTLRLSQTGSEELDGSFFENMNDLTQLYLSDNLITTLPENLLPVFNTFTRVSLDGNPLHCNCEVLWFHKWLEVYSHIATPPACKTPVEAKLQELEESQLICSAPTSIVVKEKAENSHQVVLQCSAESDPPPTITWRDPAGEEFFTLPSLNRNTLQNEQSILANSSGGMYTCIASNLAGIVSREIDVATYSSASALSHQYLCLTLLFCLLLCLLKT